MDPGVRELHLFAGGPLSTDDLSLFLSNNAIFSSFAWSNEAGIRFRRKWDRTYAGSQGKACNSAADHDNIVDVFR